MRNIFVNLIITMGLLSFYACDGLKKEVDPPRTATEPECVVHSYLSVESPQIEVALQWSVPTFNDNRDIFGSQVIENARVKLSDESGKFVFLPFDISSGMYVANAHSFPIKGNEKYYLDVEIPNQPEITAECIVPAKLQTSIQNMRIVNTFDSGEPAYYIAFEFDDIPHQKNYYLVDFEITNDFSYSPKVELLTFTDTNRENKKIFVRSENILGKVNGSQKVTVNLFSVDRSFYDYKRTSLQQKESEEMGPFAEPVIIISNINNGLGVFGGYSKISKTENL